jgi:hypothetical protein
MKIKSWLLLSFMVGGTNNKMLLLLLLAWSRSMVAIERKRRQNHGAGRRTDAAFFALVVSWGKNINNKDTVFPVKCHP